MGCGASKTGEVPPPAGGDGGVSASDANGAGSAAKPVKTAAPRAEPLPEDEHEREPPATALGAWENDDGSFEAVTPNSPPKPKFPRRGGVPLPQDAEDYEPPIAEGDAVESFIACLLYTSPSPRDATLSRMPSSA